MNKRKKVIFAGNVSKFCYLTLKYIRKRKSVKKCVRSEYQNTTKFNFFETTFNYMKKNDKEQFFKYTRMNRAQYDLLLSLVESSLTNSSSIRKSITSECRLALTLAYLSQGFSRRYLAKSFQIEVSTVRQIIIEVCEVLWKLLSPKYLPPPNTINWINIANDFKKCNVPNCIGSIDAKKVEIKFPSKYNNEKQYSIDLIGICDANYIFTVVDVGTYSSENDEDIFRNSIVGQVILDNELIVQSRHNLPNSDKEIPLYFIADIAFPLEINLMKPYSILFPEFKKENFNKRISVVRNVIENAFGILITRWRILLNPIEFHYKNARKIILACIILHNFVKTTSRHFNCHIYDPPNYTDTYDEGGDLILGLWRQDNIMLESLIQVGEKNYSTREALKVRETLADYFMNDLE